MQSGVALSRGSTTSTSKGAAAAAAPSGDEEKKGSEDGGGAQTSPSNPFDPSSEEPMSKGAREKGATFPPHRGADTRGEVHQYLLPHSLPLTRERHRLTNGMARRHSPPSQCQSSALKEAGERLSFPRPGYGRSRR